MYGCLGINLALFYIRMNGFREDKNESLFSLNIDGETISLFCFVCYEKFIIFTWEILFIAYE